MKNNISYLSKTKIKCPACDNQFALENFFTGRGRLNAKELGNDLRRIYEPSKKFGHIYPLIYNIVVCPKCWLATLPEDFENKNNKPHFNYEEIKNLSPVRKKEAEKIIDKVNFKKNRDLYSGLISYFLAIACYQNYLIQSQKNIKQALMAIRGAWIIDDILNNKDIDEDKKENFSSLKEYFRFFALQKIKYYFEKIHFAKKKNFIEIKYHGPDLDHDYGYEGLVYIYSYLTYEFIELEKDLKKKLQKMEEIKIMLGKIFGFGKASKKKPSPLLDKSKFFYDILKEKIKALEKQNS